MEAFGRKRNVLARASVFYHFMLEGIMMGIWSNYLPAIQIRLNLTDTELGSAVLFCFLCQALAAPVAAILMKHFGSRMCTSLGALFYGISLPLMPLSPNFGVLCVAMSSFGFNMGLMDVGMNSCGVLTEIVERKPLLGSFHGSYSISAAAGSLLGAALVSLGGNPVYVFAIVSAVTVVLTFGAYVSMYNHQQEMTLAFQRNGGGGDQKTSQYESITDSEVDDVSMHSSLIYGQDNSSNCAEFNDTKDESTAAISSHRSQFSKFCSSLSIMSMNGAVLYLCLVVYLAAFGESSIVTWSIVYVQRYVSSQPELQTMGFTCFQVCMAVGRFSTDYLRRLYGRRRIVQLSGVLAMTGLSLAVAAPSLGAFNSPVVLGVACVGFAVTGLGLSTLIPTMMSSAGHLQGGRTTTSLAIVGGFTYSGSIICSPFVGAISDSVHSLRYALIVVAVLVFFISPLGFGIRKEGDNKMFSISTSTTSLKTNDK